jgi:hypothetical protein
MKINSDWKVDSKVNTDWKRATINKDKQINTDMKATDMKT